MSERATAIIDLQAIRSNLDVVRERAGAAGIMAIVKADAYGHGMMPIAREARAHGVDWLGVALPAEALLLRGGGDTGRILAWLWSPGDPAIRSCVHADIDLSVSSGWALEEVASIGREVERPARIHLKVDTGLARNGVSAADWPRVVQRVAELSAEGVVDVVGLWSHLADADTPGSITVQRQRDAFLEAIDIASAGGVSPSIRHLSNSGGLWAREDCRFELARVGIAMYGLTPSDDLASSAELGLTPAMTLRASLANVKAVPAGTSVSYGGTWTAANDTVLGLVPLGYADGIPRAAGNNIPVTVAGRRRAVVGRVAMDQFVIDLEGQDHAAGEEVFVFGPGANGELTADQVAQAIGTIGYEIVTRIGPRVPRLYVNGRA